MSEPEDMAERARRAIRQVGPGTTPGGRAEAGWFDVGRISDTPPPPVNVRIVRRDGTEIPCEVRYAGCVIHEDGEPIDEWEAVSEYLMSVSDGDIVRVGKLPSRCAISFVARPWEPRPEMS